MFTLGNDTGLLTFPSGIEISFAGEVPMPPNFRPVVILSGSDYEMGYQFYQQLIQIFGPWILERPRVEALGILERGPKIGFSDPQGAQAH